MLKIIFLLLSVCPLLWEIRRLHKIWAFSPLDRYDVFYMILGVIGGIYLAWKHGKKEAAKTDHSAWVLLLPLLAVGIAGFLIPLNVLYSAGAIGIGFGMVWLLWGWPLFWRLAPAGVWMGLSIPTSSIAVMIPDFSDWFWLKLIIAFLVFIYVLLAEYLDLRPRPGQGFFYLGMTLLVLILMIGMPRAMIGDSFELVPNRKVFKDYIGAATPLTSFDKRFFRGCRSVERSRFVSSDNHSFISLLEIVSGDNVHNIHPAVVCLRSMGWQVIRSEQKTAQISGRTLAYDRILVNSEEQRQYLMIVWYSDSSESTGSYFHFRRSWKSNRRWMIYQIMTPVRNHDVKEAQRLLLQFMEHFSAPAEHSGKQKNFQRIEIRPAEL